MLKNKNAIRRKRLFSATSPNKILIFIIIIIIIVIIIIIIRNFFHLFSVTSHNKFAFDKPVFNSVNRLNHSSKINNTLRTKMKHFPHLFTSAPQIPLKLKWYHFLP